MSTKNKCIEEFIKVSTEYFMTIHRIWSEVNFEGSLDKSINEARANAVESIISTDLKVEEMLSLLLSCNDEFDLPPWNDKKILSLAWANTRRTMLAEHEMLINSIKPN